MAVDLCTRLVQRVQDGPAQLKLAAWLQRHALPILGQPNDLPLLNDGLPAKPLLYARQQRRNLLVRESLAVCHVVPQLLVLRANPAAQNQAGGASSTRGGVAASSAQLAIAAAGATGARLRMAWALAPLPCQNPSKEVASTDT